MMMGDSARGGLLRWRAVRSAIAGIAVIAIAGCANEQELQSDGSEAPPHQESWQRTGSIKKVTACLIAAFDKEFRDWPEGHEALEKTPGRIYEVRPRQRPGITGDAYLVRVSALTDGTLRIEVDTMAPEASLVTGRVLRAVDQCR